MLNLSIRPIAEQDIQQIVDYYDNIMPDLTDSFLYELDEIYKHIKQNPQGYQKRLGNIRSIFLKRFPIGVFYKLYEKKIVVIAVLHTGRSPKIWQNR